MSAAARIIAGGGSDSWPAFLPATDRGRIQTQNHAKSKGGRAGAGPNQYRTCPRDVQGIGQYAPWPPRARAWIRGLSRHASHPRPPGQQQLMCMCYATQVSTSSAGRTCRCTFVR